MLSKTPNNLLELEEKESFVQHALLSTVGFDLKQADKLRELTCKLLGKENGYLQLQSEWSHGQKSDTNEVVLFSRWLVTSISLYTKESSAIAKSKLCMELEDLVFQVCDESYVTDYEVNNELDSQIEAIYNHSNHSFESIITFLVKKVYINPRLSVSAFEKWKEAMDKL